MKIVHIIERFNPLLGQEINFIAKNKSEDFEMTILTSSSLKPWNLTLTDLIIKEDKKYHENNNVLVIRNDVLFEYGEKLWITKLCRTIKKLNPDVLYVHGIEYISFIRILLWKVLLRKKIKIFADTHSLPQFAHGTLFRTVYYFLLRKLIIPTINKLKIIVFYTAAENKILLRDIYKVNEENIKPFCIGADLSKFFYSSLERENIRKKYNIHRDDILILYSGRICMQKQPHLILESLLLIKTKIKKKITVIFVGFHDDTYKSEYIDIYKRDIPIITVNQVPSDILFQYYSAADIAVFPRECTLSSLDCQASKLSVIMEYNQTNKYRVKGGLIYEKNNINDLSNKIFTLIKDDNLRKELSNVGYTYIKENYSYVNNLRNMEFILKSGHQTN